MSFLSEIPGNLNKYKQVLPFSSFIKLLMFLKLSTAVIFGVCLFLFRCSSITLFFNDVMKRFYCSTKSDLFVQEYFWLFDSFSENLWDTQMTVLIQKLK